MRRFLHNERGQAHPSLGIIGAMKPNACLLVALLAACGSHAVQPQPGTATAQHGVYVADLDRAADPCTDFYEYANGTWRKDNPIPAEMPRWSGAGKPARAPRGGSRTSSTRSRRARTGRARASSS